MKNIVLLATQIQEAQQLIGETIRAYDFKPVRINGEETQLHPDCFIEGKVKDVQIVNNHGFGGYAAFIVECEVDSWDEEPAIDDSSRVGQIIQVPIQVSRDYEGRIQLIA